MASSIGGGGGGGAKDVDDGEERDEEVWQQQREMEESTWKGEGKTSEADVTSSVSAAELIAKTSEYFYGDMDLVLEFENFVNERCGCMDLESSEYKLEYTAAYEDYKDLFEKRIGGFIERVCQKTVEEFYEALQAKTDEDEFSNEAVFGQILVSVLDFDIFMTMMREAAQKRQRK